MLPEEVLRKIHRFHFQTKRRANNVFAGQYESAFRGQGMEFAEVREYEVGDDMRNIDWNVSARFGRPFVKIFHEERELTVMLLLDLSGSHLFGTRKKFKRDLLVEVAGMLAFLAIRTNDRVGAILFSSKVERFIPPKKGPSHVWNLIKEIFTYPPEDLTTDLEGALAYMNRVIKRHAVVFLISDCLGTGFERTLKLTAKKYDLTVIRLSDPAEDALPDVGLLCVRDPETGETAWINTRDEGLRRRWLAHRRERAEAIEGLLRQAGADLLALSTGGPVVEPLTQLFERRRRRL